MFSRHVSRSRRTVRSSQLVAETITGSPSPAASRVASPCAKSGTSPRPFDFQIVEGEQRRSERDDEERQVRPPAGERERHEGTGEEERVGGLQRERHARERPRKHRLAVGGRAKRPDGEGDRPEHGDDRGEVRLLGQPERLRQELVHPRVVVALDEVGNRERTARPRTPPRTRRRRAGPRGERRCRRPRASQPAPAHRPATRSSAGGAAPSSSP